MSDRDRTVPHDWSPATLEARASLANLGRFDVPLGPYCTYRVGGPAALLVEIDTEDELEIVAATTARTQVDTLVIGRGSNLLVTDRGFDGIVIVLGAAFNAIDVPAATSTVPGEADSHASKPPFVVSLGGAALLPVAARATVRAGLTGFEWAVGVPGSVGGAVRMNAGGHGADMSDSLVGCEIVDLATGERSWMPADQLELAYRHSNLTPQQVVVRAEIGLHRGVGSEEERLSEIVRWRRAHQPGGANAGSVFANPPGDSAGRLIDAAGLKGHRIGAASVSTKHANFIQVEPGEATADGGGADDVYALIVDVMLRVERFAGVRLRPENRLIGFEPPAAPLDREAIADSECQ